jgi:predicted amidohydrolase
LGVVQMALGPTIAENRSRILDGLARAARARVRVAVFPEGALSEFTRAAPGEVERATSDIAREARRRNLYVIYGGWTYGPRAERTNWMKAVGPDGGELLHYDKLWDVHTAAEPQPFLIDGVKAAAIICADRWLRAVEDLPFQRGAQVSFELSNNFASEWVPALEWYWYAPRAVRNTAWVVFANSANRVPGQTEPGAEPTPRHGHSAVIAPDGKVKASAPGDGELLLRVDLNLDEATRAEALARAAHPALERFWRGEGARAEAFRPLGSAAVDLTVAAVQAANAEEAERGIRQAAERGADLATLPMLDPEPGLEERLARAARESAVAVAYGVDGAAAVLSAEGRVLTRHLALTHSPRATLKTMWFEVKGVPAVVSVGRDALWNEIAELAALAGARVHVNVASEPVPDRLFRRQVGAAMSSFQTLTVMANRAGPGRGRSAVWDDLNAREETRRAVRGEAPARAGDVLVYSPFSANLVAEAGEGFETLVVKRRIPGPNDQYPNRTARFHPARDGWYANGARLASPGR